MSARHTRNAIKNGTVALARFNNGILVMPEATEQVDAHWRGNHAHCQVTGHEDTKVNRINAQCICDWEHKSGQDHDVRDVINDHTTDDH